MPGNKEAQHDEVMALQSIYGDDFSSIGVWKSKNEDDFPNKFRIRITPTQGEEAHAEVCLQVHYTASYPQKPPILLVEKRKGLSNSLLNQLRDSVQELAKELAGSEMIFEIAQTIQEFLQDHNTEQKSFHQQMLEREQKDEAEAEKTREARRAKAAQQELQAESELAKAIELELQKKNRELGEIGANKKMKGLKADEANNPYELLNDQQVSSPSTLPTDKKGKDNNNDDKKKQSSPPQKKKRSPSRSPSKRRGQNPPQIPDKLDLEAAGTKTGAGNVRSQQQQDENDDDNDDDDDDDDDDEFDEDTDDSDFDEDDDEVNAENEALLASLQFGLHIGDGLGFSFQSGSPSTGEGKGYDDASSEDSEDDEDEDDEGSPSFSPQDVDQYPWLMRMTSEHSTNLNHFSRFTQDFEELGSLGRGGFGKVVKARNKLDGLMYAVKQIKLKRRDFEMNKRIVREVSTIAMLHHRYIVRYYQAWIEGGDGFKDDDLDDDDGAEDWLNPSISHSRITPSFLGSRGNTKDGNQSPLPVSSADATQTTDVSDSIGGATYLYIQMEYCPNKTLRDLIDEGLCQKPDALWRLFRQILEAIGHIHKKGIIHRDVKPPNIFIDKAGNIKLGDFGLAVLSGKAIGEVVDMDEYNTSTVTIAKDQKGSSSSSLSSDLKTGSAPPRSILNIISKAGANSTISLESVPQAHSDNQITECVGTPFYRSPEQEAQGVEYDHKADIYALGIIFFEMWRPFETLMERATELTTLRETGQVPKGFMHDHPDRERVTTIIESMLERDPSDRPTCASLLKSGLVPIKIEDEYLEHALITFTKPDSNYYRRMMEVMFLNIPDPVIDYTYDYMSKQRRRHHGRNRSADQLPEHVKHCIQQQTFDRLTHLLRLHGAIELKPPLLAPRTLRTEHLYTAATFLDPSGVQVQLPYSLTVPFARYVAQNLFYDAHSSDMAKGNNSSHVHSNRLLSDHSTSESAVSIDLRRYHIGRVYRAKPQLGGPPREFYECDFDVVWREAQVVSTKHKTREEKSAALVAETIRVIVEIMQEFNIEDSAFTIRVNHLQLFDHLLDVVLPEHLSSDQESKQVRRRNAGGGGGSSLPSSPTGTPLNAALQGGGIRMPEISLSEGVTESTIDEKCLSLRGGNLNEDSVKDETINRDPVIVRRTLRQLSNLSQKQNISWQKGNMRKEMMDMKLISNKRVNRLGAMLNIRSAPGNFDEALKKLIPHLTSRRSRGHVISPQLREAIDSLQLVFEFLKLLHIERYVVFDSGLVGNYDLFKGGLVFQCFIENGRMGTNDVLAVGGRYDQLIASHIPPKLSSSGKAGDSTSRMNPLCGVGINIAVEKLVVLEAQKHLERSQRFRSGAPIRVKARLNQVFNERVLLYGMRGHLLKERCRYASLLWDEGIATEYMHPGNLIPSMLTQYCNELGVRWVVVFRKKTFMTTGIVKVADLRSTHASKSTRSRSSGSTRDEQEWQVLKSDLVPFIRRKIGGTYSESKKIHDFKESAYSPSGSSDFEVITIDPFNELRAGIRKTQVVAQAKRIAAPLAQGNHLSSLRVLTIDLPIVTIRQVISALYETGFCSDSSEFKQQLLHTSSSSGGSGKSSSSRTKGLIDALISELNRELIGSSEVNMAVIVSIPDRRADVCFGSNLG